MNKQIYKEIMVVVVLIIMSVICLLLDMPSMLYLMFHSLFIIVFSILSFFIWTSKAEDERARYYKALSSDFAFLSAGFILAIGIAYESYVDHQVDVWLMITLVFMSIVRVASQIWFSKK